MQTFSGRRFYPLSPRAVEIDIADIAHGLSNVCRYGGHAARFYSVAEHCVIVSQHLAPAFALHGLLHDSAEAYIGDMIRPLKHADAMYEFRVAEAAIERCVAERFGLDWQGAAQAEVKSVDDRILVDEMRALMRRPRMYRSEYTAGLAPLGCTIAGLVPAVAEHVFLERFQELTQ